jgi:DNA-binding transcriptional MerR regulator
MAERTYGIREFSELAGVTVRALHHYDRLGLLKPRRTQTGYRVYAAKELETLEQIVALKFIGLPLNKIKLLLRRNRFDLSTALRAQRTLLEQRRVCSKESLVKPPQVHARRSWPAGSWSFFRR